MSGFSRLLLHAAAALLLAQASEVLAGKVVLNIRVVNPSDQPQMKEVIQPLPKGLTSNDIISLDGMELRYDSAQTSYCVRAEQELGPKQSVTFEVEVNDVWVIPGDELAQLERHAKKLGGMIKGADQSGRCAMLEAAITNGLSLIALNQAGNEAARVGAERHIDAFVRDSKQLAGIRAMVAELEDIVAGTGRDPGRITFSHGERGPVGAPGSLRNTTTFRVIVMNISTNESRSVRVLQYLPPEVGAGDIVEAGGLQVKPDPAKGACCLFKDGVELKPGESITYNVIVKDKWNVNGNRIERLKARSVALWTRCKALDRNKSIEPQLAGVIDALRTVVEERGPETLDQRYIDYYKTQTKSLDIIEEYLDRFDRVMPGTVGYNPARYAWLAIYAVVIFLVLFSALVFIRISRK